MILATNLGGIPSPITCRISFSSAHSGTFQSAGIEKTMNNSYKVKHLGSEYKVSPFLDRYGFPGCTQHNEEITPLFCVIVLLGLSQLNRL